MRNFFLFEIFFIKKGIRIQCLFDKFLLYFIFVKIWKFVFFFFSSCERNISILKIRYEFYNRGFKYNMDKKINENFKY